MRNVKDAHYKIAVKATTKGRTYYTELDISLAEQKIQRNSWIAEQLRLLERESAVDALHRAEVGMYLAVIKLLAQTESGLQMLSASTFANGMTYVHANKIVNLVKGMPIGAMVTGDGGIGNESVETLLKDLRRRFSGQDDLHRVWALEPVKLSMEGVAERVREFLVDEKVKQWGRDNVGLLVRLCGYSAGRPLAETWDVNINGSRCDSPELVQAEDSFGPRWHGEFEALDRLILGIGPRFDQVALELGLPVEQLGEVKKRFIAANLAHLSVPAMPIQDAINLAKFLAETTIGFVKYSFDHPVKTVGGPVEIATITKHEGFKWVQRKHFYPADLN